MFAACREFIHLGGLSMHSMPFLVKTKFLDASNLAEASAA